MSNLVLRNCLDAERKLLVDASFISQLPGGLEPNVNKTVELDEYPCDCWTITDEIEPGPNVTPTITTFYDNCYACTNGTEFYQLKNCQTGVVFQYNDLPVRFAYVGQSNEGTHPDFLLNKIISSFTDQSLNEYTGCWQFMEAESFPEYSTLDYVEFLNDVGTECDCAACSEPEEPVTPPVNLKTIYPTFKVPFCDAEYVEKIKCSFAEQVYKKMQSERYKIKPCCNDSLNKYHIKHEILKLDMIEDPELCSTKCCTCYTISITQDVLDQAIGNTYLDNTVLAYVKYCNEEQVTSLQYTAVDDITLCLSCIPVVGILVNNMFQPLDIVTTNGVCDDTTPCS